MSDQYLGDGVYASFDGYHIVLDLRAQPVGPHVCRIALEPSVLSQLINYSVNYYNDLVRQALDLPKEDPS